MMFRNQDSYVYDDKDLHDLLLVRAFVRCVLPQATVFHLWRSGVLGQHSLFVSMGNGVHIHSSQVCSKFRRCIACTEMNTAPVHGLSINFSVSETYPT